MRDNQHNTKFMIVVASVGAGIMALYPLSHETGILGLCIFLVVLFVELFW